MEPEYEDALVGARAAFDQIVAWYDVFGEALVEIQNKLNRAGLDPETTKIIVAQQHHKLINVDPEE